MVMSFGEFSFYLASCLYYSTAKMNVKNFLNIFSIIFCNYYLQKIKSGSLLQYCRDKNQINTC